MFDQMQGGQIAWLIPAALVAGLLLRGRAARTDGPRAQVLLWGGRLLVTGQVFSFMAGTDNFTAKDVDGVTLYDLTAPK
ncbi:hypothetical protein [Nocardia sp. NPDC002869]|uniref:hypothetical protein n=1 Tax=Nocardia sp. NPDC002869 TaxID=3161032 RepID=UPI00398C942D